MRLDQDLLSLVDLVSNVTDAYTAALFLPQESGGVLKLRAVHTLSDHLRKDLEIHVGQGLIGWVAERGDPLHSTEFKHDLSALGIYHTEEGIKSFMAVPVATLEGTGVLSIDSKRQYVFTPKVQKVLAGFAEQVSRKLEKTDVYRQIGRQGITLDTLRDYAAPIANCQDVETVLDAACNIPKRLLDYDLAALVKRDPGENVFTVARSLTHSQALPTGHSVALDHSLAGWVLEKAETLHLPTIKDELQEACLFHPDEPHMPIGAFLGIPLKIGEDILGMLAFARKEPGGFDSREIAAAELLQGLISGPLAAALMRAHSENVKSRDEVTGLPHFSEFSTHLSEALAMTSDTLRPLSILVAEAEVVRTIYASRGRHAGDKLMARLAEFYQEFLEESELLSRFLGHRFLMAFPGKDLDTDREFARMLQDTLEHRYFRAGSDEVRAPTHFGLAVFPRDGSTEGQLIAQALRALEWAKTRGQEPICTSAEVKG